MTPTARRRRAIAMLAIVALALAASAASLRNGFAYDDDWIVVRNGNVHHLAGWWRCFTAAYWPPEKGGGLYRPLTTLAFAAQWAAGGGAPWVFHAVNVALYAATCAALFWLATMLLPEAAAWIAAALFAVHPVHVEAVGNVVGQSELVVALCAVLSAALYLRWRAHGPLTLRRASALVALYAAATLSKEHGILLPALLVALEATIPGTADPLRARLRRLAPLALGCAAVAIAYIAARTTVLGALAGDAPHAAFARQSPGTRLLTMLGVVPQWGRLLLWPAHLAADYSPPQTPILDRPNAAVLGGVGMLLFGTALAALALRVRPVVTFGLAWLAIAILPVSNVVIPSGVLLAERTLFLPSVGAMLALGAGAWWLLARLATAAAPTRIAAGGALATLLALGVTSSARRQAVWYDTPTLFAQMVVDAPLSYRAHWAYGGTLLTRGRAHEAAREWRVAIALFPEGPDVRADLAQQYVANGFYWPAIALFREVLAIAPGREDARAGLLECLLRVGQFEQAREEARLAVARGDTLPLFRERLVALDTVLARRTARVH